MRSLLLFCLLATLMSGTAHAQASSQLLKASQLAKDLSFPDKTSSFSMFGSPKMALYKPEGPGPFPALVLQHQCGGLINHRSGWRNDSMLEWARTAVKHGYVALLLDSLGPRGASSVCMGVQEGVNFPRGVRDTLQAAEHLRTFDFVDRERIALAGYSWGAMSAALASSKAWGHALASGERLQAAVAFYPGCFPVGPPGNTYEVVRPDIDRPLLVLMGDQDTETPPDECVPRLEAAKAAGAPVEWHVYSSTTHCWDCKNLHNYSKVDRRSTQVVYRYDENITRESERRMFEFLNRVMPARSETPR